LIPYSAAANCRRDASEPSEILHAVLPEGAALLRLGEPMEGKKTLRW
jgi:hypothetical protein